MSKSREWGSSQPPRNTDVRHLDDWWMDETRAELLNMMPKVQEYGSMDLEIMGIVLHMMMNRGGPVIMGSYEELGIFFYVLGKVARWAAAIADGHKASDDTIRDISIYARMALRVRHANGWPGPVRPQEDE